MEVTFIADPKASQAEEAFVVALEDGRVEQMRIHEYDRIFAIQGLYEEVVQNRLRCASPEVLAKGLTDEVRHAGYGADAIRVLDVGAGNGLVGENLRQCGVHGVLVGLDSEPMASRAVRRDRPGLYAEFLTTTLDELEISQLVDRFGLTCLVAAGAVGTGHISIGQITRIWQAFPDGAWLGLTFNESALSHHEGELREFVDELRTGEHGTELCRLDRFRHRLHVTGAPIFSYLLVAHKV